MNFFEHQDQARRQTRKLIILFFLAVVAIIVAMNLVVLGFLGVGEPQPGQGMGWLEQNSGLILTTTLLTGGVIGLASLFRTMNLRGGGSTVARELGGDLVETDTSDPLKRRLRNVVEEMAIASGVPVPDIFVLEHEQGINAFAAGYSTSDAAVAVTRGALENLSRDELQGVIAHEFSHILNGDMRLNIRLIGVLFGILIMAVMGRRLLFSMRFAGRNRNAGAIVMLGLAVMVIGYIGLFFARWIKAAVSRQREYLADASAVQFTRQPDGIAGALKKIGAASAGSHLQADSEEVGHMLFGSGMSGQMFATHPPLVKRIKAIEPGFDPAELKTVAEGMQRHAEARKAMTEEDVTREEKKSRGPGGMPLDPDNLVEAIGKPGTGQIMIAAALAASMPPILEQAAHSVEWAPEMVCYLLLSRDMETREGQLLMIAKSLGSESEQQVRTLLHADPELAPAQRLPLLEMAFPAIRRRPARDLAALEKLIDELIRADGRIDAFEYALARVTRRQIHDALNPGAARSEGRRRLDPKSDHVATVLAILAHHGHESPGEAEKAFGAGMADLGAEDASYQPPSSDWPEHLDKALEALDELRMKDKQRLVHAMSLTIMEDGKAILQEIELLRAVCAVIHVPLPVME